MSRSIEEIDRYAKARLVTGAILMYEAEFRIMIHDARGAMESGHIVYRSDGDDASVSFDLPDRPSAVYRDQSIVEYLDLLINFNAQEGAVE